MPKAFISYNWTSSEYQAGIVEYAKRLLDEGVDVLMDVFDLREGDDKHAYMERMVNDVEVSHVLMFCDQPYVSKANSRKAGVGTESQIISQELYLHTTQSKFIAIVCEKADDEKSSVPTFYAGRIYIDFSSPEAVNNNWERLLRVLHNRPLHSKPPLGKTPSYLLIEAAPHNPASAKLASLRQAILSGKPSVKAQRSDFLEACLSYMDELRPRNDPGEQDGAQYTQSQFHKLKPVRDLIIDWTLAESVSPSAEFRESLLEFLAGLLNTSDRPEEVRYWTAWWYSGHRVFSYDVFLYVVAALMKTADMQTLHDILTSHYPILEANSRGADFAMFDAFFENGEILKKSLSSDGREYYCASAELIKRSADRSDLTFRALVDADAIALLMSYLNPAVYWPPGPLLCHAGERLPFFQRAVQHKGFAKLATVTGISDADDIRRRVSDQLQRSGFHRSASFGRLARSFATMLQMEHWDSIK